MDTVGKMKTKLEDWTNPKCYSCGQKPQAGNNTTIQWYCISGHVNAPLKPLEGDAEQLSLMGQSVDNTSQALQYMQVSSVAEVINIPAFLLAST